MNVNALIDSIKASPDYGKVGMILAHNGVVRETSRDGRRVSGLEIKINREKLAEIITRQKQRPGIVDIRIELAEEGKKLSVGDDVMCLVVAGDIRENVIETLTETLNAVKSSVTSKTEYFLEP
jgi:molybdopterin synthase catalytic subunit